MIKFDRFKDGKRNILTMSYDDGPDADRRLVEIFNKYGIRGSFHLNSGLFGNNGKITAGEVGTLYKNHEVSCHTVTHPFLERIPTVNAIKEVMQDRENLEKLCGYPVRGMSYPYGTYDDNVIEILRLCGIKYCRSTQSTGGFGFPKNFLTWTPTCHHNNDIMEKGKTFVDNLKFNWRTQLFYVWGHSYEFNNQNNWNVIEDFCEFMGGRDEIWYATNIEIYDYITAQRNLQISADESIIFNPSVLTVWIEKDGELIEIPGGATIKF